MCNSVLENGEKKMMKYKGAEGELKDMRDEIKPIIEDWTKKGYRVIAQAQTEFPLIKDWIQAKQLKQEVQPDGTSKYVIQFTHAQNILTGLIALEDPLKNRLQDSLFEFKKSGVKM